MVKVSKDAVVKVASLARIPLKDGEEEKFAKQFSATLDVIEKMNELDTAGVESTSQVTNLENMTREDVVDPTRVFTQEQALSGAKQTHNGFFVTPSVLNQ